MMEQEKKTEFVERELKTLLSAMPEGARLPSIRRLMEKYGVSQMVVDQALDSLEQSGWISRKKRKGVFRYGIGGRGGFRLAAICRDWGSVVYSEIETQLRKLCGESEIAVEKFVFPIVAESIFRYVPINEFDIILVVDPLPLQNADLIRICNLSIPILFLGGRFEFTMLNYISTVPMENGVIGAEYLWRNGCRKPAILYGEPRNPDHDARRLGFERVWRMKGAEVLLLDAHTSREDNSCRHTWDFLKRYFAEHPKPEFDSLYLLGDAFHSAVLKVLEEYHCRVPEDVCVLGSDGNDAGLFCSVPLTTIGVPYQEYVGKICDAIRLLLHDRMTKIQMELPCRIIERASVIRRQPKEEV